MRDDCHKDDCRCGWARGHDSLRVYHDHEWGVPEYDSRALWEKLMLDGFQAGLSWLTILNKRDAFREAFIGFEPVRVAAFDEAAVATLLDNAAIVRSRAKIEATIGNAKAYLAMAEAGEDFVEFAWAFVNGSPLLGDGQHVPTQTQCSADLSKALKKRGFKFVGPTIVYAWMQAVGMVNDHSRECFRRYAV